MFSGTIRCLTMADAAAALTLYDYLTSGPRARDETAFARVLEHAGTRIFGAFVDGQLTSMATLHVLPNVTWDARPYALVENVITVRAFRRQGHGRAVMQAAIDHAWLESVHKIMLMTGQHLGAKEFYESIGFSSDEKFALVLHGPDP